MSWTLRNNAVIRRKTFEKKSHYLNDQYINFDCCVTSSKFYL